MRGPIRRGDSGYHQARPAWGMGTLLGVGAGTGALHLANVHGPLCFKASGPKLGLLVNNPTTTCGTPRSRRNVRGMVKMASRSGNSE